jgi:peptidoglycan/xylan/chitin deacetylase (PgdA/CDA1 family)
MTKAFYQHSRTSAIYFLVFSLILWFFLNKSGAESVMLHSDPSVPILLYHRFSTTVTDSMTVTTPVFRSHLRYLKEHGYTILPLRQLVQYYLRKGPLPPARSVVIVVDDGHKSVYTDMLPVVREFNIPVTLFIYPSAISNAPYAMTWEQLHILKKTGLFEFQSHSYWHPNFKKEKKRLTPGEYEKFIEIQLRKSKEKIQRELNVTVDMLAWPFGIYDDQLVSMASKQGYVAGFTIERRHTHNTDSIMTLPRYLMTNQDSGKRFQAILTGHASPQRVQY